MEFWWCLRAGALKCARLEFSGCHVKPRRPKTDTPHTATQHNTQPSGRSMAQNNKTTRHEQQIVPKMSPIGQGMTLVGLCGAVWCVGFAAAGASHDNPRTPNVHISGPRRFKHHQNSTKGPPRERRKKENCGGRGKESEMLGPPPFGAPTLRGPPFGAPPFGPHPSGLYFFCAFPCFSVSFF